MSGASSPGGEQGGSGDLEGRLRVVIAQSVPDAVRAAEGVDGWLRVGGETGLLCLLQELQGLGGVGGGVANGLPGDPGDGADTVRVVSKPN